MTRPTMVLVHPSVVDPGALLAMFEDPAFTFRTWVGHLLPQSALETLLADAVPVLDDRGGPVGLVGVEQMAEDHAGHYRLDVRVRQPHQVHEVTEAVALGVALARSEHEVVRLTAVLEEDDLHSAAAYRANGFVDEGVLRGVLARDRARVGTRVMALIDAPVEAAS